MTGSEASRIIQVGVVGGDLVVPAADPVETAYHRQVARMAPPRLLDRDDELAELARFCTSPDTAGAYRWWQAGPWSGKTALMAWFALHPPPGVRVVSFFVTGRHAAQNDRVALVENVLEQLLALHGRALPALLTESTREAHLLDLLARAAQECRRRGEHLVLLVDGIDEDRGVTDGPDAHSIAALLPVEPPDGLRVVVAGRPEPAVPPDVPADHPLRRPEVVRPLAGCRAARVEQADLVRELRVLLATDRTADLVGLLTAAGGGLAAPDLAELTGRSYREVDDLLGTVAARSLSRREGHHRPDRTVFLLAHEELHREAVELLGPARLAAHLDRLHAWAAAYRARGWPEDTPEYLLRGWFARLVETGDAAAFTACATDPARHARLLAVSGGDAAALAEVVRAQRELTSGRTPPVVEVAGLAVHRIRLRSRIEATHPVGSPALWAIAGRLEHARALAESTDPARREDAVLRVVEAAARHGHLAWAAEVADRLPVLRTRVHALERVIRAAADLGHADHARALLERVGTAGHGVDVMPSLVRSLLALGEVDRAREIAESIPSARKRDNALRIVAEALAARADTASARDLAVAVTGPIHRDRALAALVEAAVEAREPDFVQHLVTGIRDPAACVRALTVVVPLVVAAGGHERAAAVLRWWEDAARAQAEAQCLARLSAALAEPTEGAVSVGVAGGAPVGAAPTPSPPDPERALRRLRRAALREVGRDPLRARRVLARYLVAEDRPEHLVATVRRVAPEALPAIAAEVARWDPPPGANAANPAGEPPIRTGSEDRPTLVGLPRRGRASRLS
ncbi:hypothetical protein [Saccharothrix variisporea]|uniref:hypothetical protein n=1 Tax=Saccharothrix variisporea TaxID=543527 RepID=UPI0011C394CC|nr:hypothetical protein [Saccharothrix variisporea]